MTHVDPTAHIYGGYPDPAPNTDHYDQVGERLHFDTEADDIRRDVDALHGSGQHSGQLAQALPSGAELATRAAAEARRVNKISTDANAINQSQVEMQQFDADIPAVSGNYGIMPANPAPGGAAVPAHGPLAQAAADKARARNRLILLVCCGSISGLVVGGGVMAGLYIHGVIKAATPSIVQPPATAAPPPTPDETTLRLWLTMPDDAFFKLFGDQIRQDTVGMNLVNTSYVASALSKIYNGIFPPDQNADYKAALIDDVTIDGDISALKASAKGVTLTGVYDRSAAYPDTATTDAAVITKFGRGVRLDYLARAYVKVLAAATKAKAAAAAAGTGT